MKTPRKKGATLAVFVLIAVIAFTSTSVAGEACDRAFYFLYSLFFGHLHSHGHAYEVMHFVAEKGVHFGLFLALATLLIKGTPDARWRMPLVLLSGLGLSVASEFLQFFFPGRDPSVRDVLIDFGGTVFGVVLNMIIQQRSATTTSQLFQPGTSAAVIAPVTDENSQVYR